MDKKIVFRKNKRDVDNLPNTSPVKVYLEEQKEEKRKKKRSMDT